MVALLKSISRVTCMYFILVVIIGTCFVIKLLVNLFLKTGSVPFFYMKLLKMPPKMLLYSSNIVYYPDSRYYNECRLIYTAKTNGCNIDPSLYYFSKYDDSEQIDSLQMNENRHQNGASLTYLEFSFRTAMYPILWLDSFGDVRWNEAAEREMYQLLLHKQFPNPLNSQDYMGKAASFIKDCDSRQLFLLEQWARSGFLSRSNCLIEQFGQSLYSPLMAVLLPKKFDMASAGTEDFMHEGLLGYYAPISQCSAYIPIDRLKNISESLLPVVRNQSGRILQYTIADTFEQLRQEIPSKKYLWLRDQWKFGYEHVPHRRWLFDRDSHRSKTFITYHSPVDVLTDHSSEHIYHTPNLNFDLNAWHPRNQPVYSATVHVDPSYKITWRDRVFTAFLRYMFTLFFHQFAPRIEVSKNLLARYWSSYLADSKHQPYHQALSSMAVVYARRGDYARGDTFYRKFGYWRNISLFLKTLHDEEKRINKNFSSIFFLSDDASFVNSAVKFASTNSSEQDEKFARQYLSGRAVIYNIYAPDSCRIPLSRFDFDQYLVGIQLIIRHSKIIIPQARSNLVTYVEAVRYAQKQLIPDQQTNTYIKYVSNQL